MQRERRGGRGERRGTSKGKEESRGKVDREAEEEGKKMRGEGRSSFKRKCLSGIGKGSRDVEMNRVKRGQRVRREITQNYQRAI